MPNRLARESSPYLRQHQDNPVDWYPWAKEALERARAEDKPILLSIGYSACHWCHVMAHESFENPGTARLMNENFINIKVDREERPDLDHIYQNVAQAMTGAGGWPLTVFLTPDLKPFFGGTYFPPMDKYGRPGFPRVLKALSDAYRDDRKTVDENSARLVEIISSAEGLPRAAREPGRSLEQGLSLELLRSAAKRLVEQVDWQHGGLGGAPKFPNTMTFSFLWRLGLQTGEDRWREAAVLALQRMLEGGIYDQLGGGFARYSVDPYWSVPHFEKMLYDNALLLQLLAEVLLTDELGGKPLLDESRRTLFLEGIEQTLGYLLREMRSPEGGFYSAQDADSEGVEGKFFVWTPAELEAALGPDDARLAALRYGVTDAGNFENGATVLHRARTIEEIAREIGAGDTAARIPEIARALEGVRARLFEARSKRVPPGLDDKVLAGWNGLAISGLLWASAALDRAGRVEASRRASDSARGAYAFLREKLARGDGRLHGSLQGGRARFNAYLDDYAFLAAAALDLARFSSDQVEIARALDDAEKWVDAVLAHFADPDAPGYFFTSDDHEALIQRPKTLYDQAIPSGTSVILGVLAALAEMDRSEKAEVDRSELERQLNALIGAAEKQTWGLGQLLLSGLLSLHGPVVVSGSGASQAVVHPGIFQKDSDERKILVCHRRACGLPHASAEDARKEAVAKLLLE
jgi:uncharacterized protein YyaL (SSP411 family)